jgi:anti-anti-sigma factor
MFEIHQRMVGEGAVFHLRGRLETEETRVQVVEQARRAVLGGSPRVVIDLDGVTRMSSEGIGTLMATKAAVEKAGGEMGLMRVTGHNRDLLVVMALVPHFAIFDESEDAERWLREAPRPEPAGVAPAIHTVPWAI